MSFYAGHSKIEMNTWISNIKSKIHTDDTTDATDATIR